MSLIPHIGHDNVEHAEALTGYLAERKLVRVGTAANDGRLVMDFGEFVVVFPPDVRFEIVRERDCEFAPEKEPVRVQ